MYDAPQQRCVSMVLMNAARNVATISPLSPAGMSSRIIIG